MSEVYEGRHRASGEPVAVKVLRPHWCLHAEVVARFLNEARALQELRHPHLVQALDSGVLPEGAPFMILEWLPDGSAPGARSGRWEPALRGQPPGRPAAGRSPGRAARAGPHPPRT